jgi:hypothetical protein
MTTKSTLKTTSAASVIALGLIIAAREVFKRLKKPVPVTSSPKAVNEAAKLGIYPDVIDALPRRCYRYDGKPVEPMNLILIGTLEDVHRTWIKAGWLTADPVSAINMLRALGTLIMDTAYQHGPMTPLFVGNKIQDFSFQKPTKINKFRQRHHARIWSTPFASTGGKPVWIAHASYDIDIKSIFSFPPAHQIDPDLDTERSVVVKDLTVAGAQLRGYVDLHTPHQGINAWDDHYETDGRAAVIEVSA